MQRGENPNASVSMDLTTKIEQMQEQNSDVFKIPDYFVYMSRAFGTLEGIGLSSDPNYSITKECFPYLAKRLITDDSPRARAALKMLIYGKDNELNLRKLQEVTSGLESYTTSTSSAESSRGVSDEGKNAAVELLGNVLLSEDGNYVQELFIEETAMILDTTIRSRILSPFEPVKSLQFGQVPLPLRPLTFPLELAKLTLDLQSLDTNDKKRLDNIRILTDILNTGRSNRADINREAGSRVGDLPLSKIIKEASKRRSALARVGLRFGESLANVQAKRLRERSISSNDELAKQVVLNTADTFDTIADVISRIDKSFSKFT